MTQVDNARGKSTDSLGDPGTLIFENDRVRIWELVIKPGETSNWHDHETDHLLVLFNGAEIANLADGSRPETAERFDTADEQLFFMPGTPGRKEWPINVSKDRTLRELIIDLKDGPFEAKHERAVIPLFAPETPTTCWTPSPDEYS